MEAKGWDEADVILFSGDAYVDHPSFGAAVVGRILEAEGLRVAIVPQPNWRDDLRDFRKLGRPRLFFGVSAGAMDSMVNKYTANRRLRSEDAYTPDRRSDMRPDYPTIVYTRILKELFPDVPVIVGGIEASLRRLTHYDYWQDKLLPGILYQSGADLLIYGMGELPLHEIAQRLIAGEPFDSLKSIRQIAYLVPKGKTPVPCENDRHLFSHEECLSDKRKQAQNFREIEIQSNRYEADRILQAVGDSTIVVNPPFPPMSTAQIDQSFDLPYTRLPHPRYKGKIISAYEMIKHSVNVHRGCFGGCAFCTISAHQGKFIASRSEASVLREVKEITEMEDFKGYLSDVGGPSANMYKMQGYDLSICKRCKKPSCIHPNVCPNLNADHRPLLDLLRRIDKNPKIKKSFIGSGVRMDLLLHNYKDKVLKKAANEYTEDLIVKHVSGRLKVAPEHSSDRVLNLMRKPPFRQFAEFTKRFQRINEAHGLRQQLIPYFISSHPPGLYRRGYGRTGDTDKKARLQTGTDTGLYSYTYDLSDGNVLHRLPSLYASACIYSHQERRKDAPAHVFLLVQTGRSRQDPSRATPNRTTGSHCQAVRSHYFLSQRSPYSSVHATSQKQKQKPPFLATRITLKVGKS